MSAFGRQRLFPLLFVAVAVIAFGAMASAHGGGAKWMRKLQHAALTNVGAFVWRNSKFDPQGQLKQPNDFIAWIIGQKKAPHRQSSMNCAQCLLYLHHLAQLLSKDEIRSIYGVDKKGKIGPRDEIGRRMTSGLGVGRAREIMPHRAVTALPPGTLVFLDGTTHLAMAIGENRYASLWLRPNNNRSLQILHLDELLTMFPWESIKALENPFGLSD